MSILSVTCNIFYLKIDEEEEDTALQF